MSDHEAAGGADVEMGGAAGWDTGTDNRAVGGVANSVEPLALTTLQASSASHVFASFELMPDPDEKNPPPTSSPAGSSKMRSAPRKKGTAATKKPSKKTKGPRSAKPRSARAAERGAGEESSSGDDETDNGPYCLCRGPDDHRWMIGCDVCEDWFHGTCVNLDKDVGEHLVERFVCPNCTDGKRNYTRYKKMCSLPACRRVARLYGDVLEERSVFCSNEHCDAWWASIIATLPTKAASKTALEVLTQEDLIGLLIATADRDGWKLGDKPFGNIEGLWANGLPTRPDVLSEEEQAFLQTSAAERLALGNEIVQYKKMMQLLDWTNSRRQAAVDAGKFTKDSCGYDWRLDAVSVRVQFAAWLDGPEGQAVFKAGRLDAPAPAAAAASDVHHHQQPSTDPAIRGACDRKRCKPHAGWYKLLMGVVRVLIKETATAAAAKLEAEAAVREAAEARYERRQLENNYVEVLSEN
ncbi:putative acetylxylan esterase [Rosellinia necatrix]|uniref:Putative acetylxylan esterase n=1 Tax=Rosellinia necatrix TaxID=77044 RepID=A0A1W2TX30_ROSNE|nr:putative acetylxylan esterase [Rosellinia necatrix]